MDLRDFISELRDIETIKVRVFRGFGYYHNSGSSWTWDADYTWNRPDNLHVSRKAAMRSARQCLARCLPGVRIEWIENSESQKGQSDG